MKRISLLLLICLFALSGYSQKQNSNSELNLDFEKISQEKPKGWSNFGNDDYKLSIDSTGAQSGKNSAVIEYHGNNKDYKAWAYTIPAKYQGKKVKLTGYVKTENVEEGFAGLWMRIDPQVAFDNMSKRGIKGTTDWTKYEIVLDLKPSRAKQIVVGGLLVGKGKMWIDNLRLTIDGNVLEKAPQKRESLAQQDKEFDKGSLISDIKLNKEKINELQSLGLIWGFLKYHHPAIAAGNYNWDYELFRILPKYMVLTSKQEREALICEWIKQLGDFKTKEKVIKSEIKIKPDLDWIVNSNYCQDLIDDLKRIEIAQRADSHYYIGFVAGVGNPEFQNETPYPYMNYPDAGFRLLSLYRYWNMIQYYFPYKNLIEEDLKAVLKEFVPKFVDAKNEKEYKLACLELIARVHDTHANINGDKAIKKYRGDRYAALQISFVENQAVVTDYLNQGFGEKTGLVIGDAITKINDQTVTEIINNRLKYTPASNYPTQLRNIATNLLRTKDSLLKIEYTRDGESITRSIKTYSTKEVNIYKRYENRDSCFRMISSDIAYINNGTLKRSDISKFWETAKNTKGLIIDIRNYPSDFPIYDLSNCLMPKSTPFVKFSKTSIESPGLFTYTKPLKAGKNSKDAYKGKLIIIVNEVSQSSAEFHAMAYRVYPNTIVIGSTTAGADGNVSAIQLPGNISTMISSIGVYYPDGSETQRVGIIPDIEVKPTIEGIKLKKDELLEKAIELINQEN